SKGDSDEVPAGFDFGCPACGCALEGYCDVCPECGADLGADFSARYQVRMSSSGRRIALAALIGLALLVGLALAGLLSQLLATTPPDQPTQ
ncbi:MAG: hypothetical protein GY778_29735, partial [bacterium]|nr:hypothetical protein [bacterium]